MKDAVVRFAGLAVALAAVTAAVAADPPFYARKATWQETMLASREALAAAEEGRLQALKDPVGKDPGNFQPFASGEVNAKQKGVRRVRVRVSGLDCVWLIATAPGRSGNDKPSGCWGDATLTGKDGKKVPLTSLKPVVTRGSLEVREQVNVAGGKKKRGRPIRIGRDELEHALVVQPDGELCYRLDGQYDWLEAALGIVAAKGNAGSMEFRVSNLPLAETLARERDREMLWGLVERDFASAQAASEMSRERARRIWDRDWKPGDCRQLAQRYVGLLAKDDPARALAAKAKSAEDVLALARAFHQSQALADQIAQARKVDLKALRRAVEDLTGAFGGKYPRGQDYLKRLADLEKADLAALASSDAAKAGKLAAELASLQRDALLDNPLLDFDRLLLIRRGNKSPKMGLPQNWQGNCSLPRNGFDDEIDILSPRPSPAPGTRPGGRLTTLFRPRKGVMVADVDLSFDADRLLFSSLDERNLWQVFEMKTDGTAVRQVTAGPIAETDNYDPCYLPNGKILFCSAAVMQGVPCVGGKDHVANLYVMDADGSNVRQLCFDQDHNWCPAVMNDGRVVFSRWEYGDTPHYFTRLLFHMNPDGTQQMALNGSNSYWPNSIFYARPIPNDASKVVAVASGHHGVPRMGELVLFDTARGRQEADGALQRIPGYGKKVEPLIVDGLVNGSWPKFLHPWPLSDKYFLVSMMDKGSSWGIWLVDVFDNMLPLCELPGYGLFEPVPLRKTPRPPIVPDKVAPSSKEATVYLTDVYTGGGLAGIPRGTVKALRVFEWHYAYENIGGHQNIGVEAGWDVKRILGTVAVEADGSALFRVPANTPLAVQPLDEQGRALQLMRSWFVGMPGEVLSCVGCHEAQGNGTPNAHTLASQHAPAAIKPWHGPARGFSFPREVQPVLDAHCTRCHNGQPMPDKKAVPNFADTARGTGGFTKSYLALHPYTRRPGPESDYHMLSPADYLANTSELIQMLEKGHQGMQLDAEAWDRLTTWIDLNVPDHGTWTEQAGEARTKAQRDLRARYRKLYANITEDPEAIYPISYKPQAAGPKPVPQHPTPDTQHPVVSPGWPFDAAEARKRQAAAGPKTARTIDLGGCTMELVLIPPGEFVMGDLGGDADERSLARVKIDRPYWMARTEVTNQQFRYFDPAHDSRFIDQHWKDHTLPGYPANGPEQPAIRLAWLQAMAFCEWLSRKTGESFSLPTEAQWEYACRAGSATPLFYGDLDADFSKFANMADLSLDKMAVKGVNPKPIPNPGLYEAFLPNDKRFNDGQMIVCDVGKYQPNPWGLLDMHGNVAEWTRSEYRPYPYRDDDGRNGAIADLRLPIADLKTQSGIGNRESGIAQRFVVRGGSWYDRPKRCRSAFRLAYPSWQRVYDVGFRVVCPAAGPIAAIKE